MGHIKKKDKTELNQEEMEKVKRNKKIQNQLINSCLLFPGKKDEEFIYVGDVVRKFGSWFGFWKKKKNLSTKDKLIGTLLK